MKGSGCTRVTLVNAPVTLPPLTRWFENGIRAMKGALVRVGALHFAGARFGCLCWDYGRQTFAHHALSSAGGVAGTFGASVKFICWGLRCVALFRLAA